MSSSNHLSETPITQRKRAFHPKSRNGCRTCKTRRVKCDEIRPSCHQCLKFWGSCEGYAAPERNTTKSKFIASKSPKISSRAADPKYRIPHILWMATLLPKSITDSRFSTQQASDDFQTFTDGLASQLPGFFTSTVWSRAMLQASHAEEFVKDAVIAIGALHSCRRNLIEDNDTTKLTPRYRHALQQWGQALKKMQSRISGDEEGLRMAIIACLLVVCFENLQGEYAKGQRHAVSGHALLQNWLAKYQDSSMVRKEGIESPAPNIIEDELVLAFSRLDLQIMTYVDPRPLPIHRALMTEGAVAISSMPGIFTSIDEARNYWDLIQRRTAHFISVLYSSIPTKTEEQEKQCTVDIPVNISSETHYQMSTVVSLLSAEQEIAARRESVSFTRDIERWFVAVSPLYAGLEVDTREWRAASILFIQAHCSEICLLTSQFGTENTIDDLVPLFRSLVALSEEVLEDSFFEGEDRFTFDAVLVNPFRLMAERCRDREVRRGAIRLLRGLGGKEGIWDGVVVAGVAECVMRVEEEWLDGNGGISWGKRCVVRELVVDEYRRSAVVRCERLDGSEERSGVVRW